MILQVALLGCSIFANRAKKLARVDMELNMLFKVAAIGCLVLAVRAAEGLGSIVYLSGMAGHLVLVGCQVAAVVTFERPLTYSRQTIRRRSRLNNESFISTF